MKRLVAQWVQWIFSWLPLSRNKMLFVSYYGSQYGCSPKYLSEYIVRRHPEWKVMWAFTQPEKHAVDGVRKVRYLSLRYFYELSTSRVFVTNYRTTTPYRKRKGQHYLQTWHNSLRLKQIEGDAEAMLPPHYVALAKADSCKVDLVLSGCRFSDETIARAFWYGGPVLPSGMPRNDLFFAPDAAARRERIKAKLNIPSATRLLLYAPTFRQSYTLACYDLDYDRLIRRLEAVRGGKWKILVRLHPHLRMRSQELLDGCDMVDVTRYDDMQELLLAADLLVTDYSSSMFDFALTRRPCLLYVPDIEAYRTQDRPLYFDLSELPFPACRSQQELEEALAPTDDAARAAAIGTFLTRVGSYEDGHASERVAATIRQWMA